VIGSLVADGLLERDAVGIRLTPRGRLLGNRVFGAFLP
jgi:coproporphyrinogen III oxidase-like Fe-S oxidoreductase